MSSEQIHAGKAGRLVRALVERKKTIISRENLNCLRVLGFRGKERIVQFRKEEFIMAKRKRDLEEWLAIGFVGFFVLVCLGVGVGVGWLRTEGGCSTRPYRTMTVEEERRTQETWGDLMNPEPPPTVHVIIEDRRP